VKQLFLKGWKKNLKNAKAATESRNMRNPPQKRMAKMMRFLDAVASNPFGIKTLKEIEKQFENDYHKNQL
jgi:hypothetical protein